MLNHVVHYVADDVFVQENVIVDKLCLQSIEGMLEQLNSGNKKTKGVYMHYERENYHNNLEKVIGDVGLGICRRTLKRVI